MEFHASLAQHIISTSFITFFLVYPHNGSTSRVYNEYPRTQADNTISWTAPTLPAIRMIPATSSPKPSTPARVFKPWGMSTAHIHPFWVLRDHWPVCRERHSVRICTAGVDSKSVEICSSVNRLVEYGHYLTSVEMQSMIQICMKLS